MSFAHNILSRANDTDGGLKYPVVDNNSCQLLGPTALVVQGLMGVLVILSLVYKRHREKPVRPWRIWLFDVSKQVIGQAFVHGLNVLISDVISHLTSGNACIFYFLNILIDTTLGVGIIYVILHLLTYIFSEKFHLKGFESGVYGDPPSVTYWLRQAAIYVLSLTTMKMLVIAIFILVPNILSIGEWLLSWLPIGDGEAFQVVFVMGIFPIIMNILQFWFIDSIVKAHNSVKLDSDSPDAFTDGDREPLFRAPSDDEEDGDMYNHHDIENPRHISQNRISSRISYDTTDARNSIPDENKSTNISASRRASDQHSYPPSLSGSFTSSSTSPKPTKKLSKAKRRETPLELNTRSSRSIDTLDSAAILQPQPQLPQVTRAAAALEMEVSQSDRSWTESWGDADNWDDQESEVKKPSWSNHAWDSNSTIRAAA